MESLFVWQPVQNSPSTVEVVITPAESFKVAKGGPKFVAAVARAAQLPLPSTWTIAPFRSQFFTEIDDNWEDRWAIAWSLTTPFRGGALANLSEGPVGIDTWDETWTHDDDVNKVSPMPCRVVADFDDQKSAAAAAAEMPELSPNIVAVPGFTRVDVLAGAWPTDAYPDCLAAAEKLVDLCARHGASTKHLDSYKRLMRR